MGGYNYGHGKTGRQAGQNLADLMNNVAACRVPQCSSTASAVPRHRAVPHHAATVVQQPAYFSGCANNPVGNLSYLEIRNYGSSSQVGPFRCHTFL